MNRKIFIFLFTLVFVLTLAGCNRAGSYEGTGASSSSKIDVSSQGDATILSDIVSAAQSDTLSKNVSSGKITEARAKEIAFAHAGTTASSVQRLKVELDNDNGVSYYEISFKIGKYEYEYDIDAETGKIINVDKEIDD